MTDTQLSALIAATPALAAMKQVGNVSGIVAAIPQYATVMQDVPLDTVLRYCVDNGIYPKLLARMANPSDPVSQIVATVLIDILKYLKLDPINLESPTLTSGLAVLVGVGDVTPSQAQAFQAMATVPDTSVTVDQVARVFNS